MNDFNIFITGIVEYGAAIVFIYYAYILLFGTYEEK